MTTQKQFASLQPSLALSFVPADEITSKVEHLLERTLTGEERKFLVLASGMLESSGKPLSRARAGAA